MKKGMTLVEVLVSLLILSIVMTAIYSILNMQTIKAINVKATTIQQTDANIALSLLRWDILMAGYGMAIDDTSIASINGPNAPDGITLRGAGLAFESEEAKWSPILQASSNTNQIVVYRFNNPEVDLTAGDQVMLLNQNKEFLDSATVTNPIDTIMHSAGEDSIPAFELTLSRNVSVGQGSIAIVADSNTYFTGITYNLANRNLMRGNNVFLENVEDIQFAYGFDVNNNGVIDSPNEWFNTITAIPGYRPQMLYGSTFAIRTTFVVMTKEGLRDYIWTQGPITIEDHVYDPSAPGPNSRRKREFINTVTWPRNLQL
jgi:prepilin-type N-terminal cleavage/methylation domain-containing protein